MAYRLPCQSTCDWAPRTPEYPTSRSRDFDSVSKPTVWCSVDVIGWTTARTTTPTDDGRVRVLQSASVNVSSGNTVTVSVPLWSSDTSACHPSCDYVCHQSLCPSVIMCRNQSAAVRPAAVHHFHPVDRAGSRVREVTAQSDEIVG